MKLRELRGYLFLFFICGAVVSLRGLLYIIVIMNILDLRNPFGAPVYHADTVSSTFDTARALAAKGAAHGTVICADFQESGRGRQGRSWTAERGKNLLFTILLRYGSISFIPVALTLKTGLALSLALEDLVPALQGSVKVKWPNDVMIKSVKAQDKNKAQDAFKAAGILTETDGENVFIGLGVNLAQTEFPGVYRSRAGSIVQACPDLGDGSLIENFRFLLLEQILTRLYEEISAPQSAGPWQERLMERLYKKGETVSFAEGSAASDHVIEGTLSGLGPGGELLIIPSGETEKRAFVNGELRVY